MGYIRHDIAVITTYQGDSSGCREALVKLRDELPEDRRHLLAGPVPGAINAMETWFFAPDGSKEGWGHSDESDRLRERFLDCARLNRHEDNSGAPWAHFSLGDDEDSDTRVVQAWRWEPEPLNGDAGETRAQ